jgi:hypothetical protein
MRTKAGFLENSSRFRTIIYSLPPSHYYNTGLGTSPRTLDEILGAPAQSPASTRRSGRLRTVLLPRVRRQLAYKMAALYPQFQSTPWLPSGFGKQSIYFLRRNQPDAEDDFTLPFISHTFVPRCSPRDSSSNASVSSTAVSSAASTVNKTLSLINRNSTEGLFALGKLLVELALDSRLEDLYEPEDQVSGDLPELTQYLAVQRLLPEVYEETGHLYGEAVRRCIEGVDVREKSVERPEFRRAFWKDIVAPLHDTCTFWLGDTL